MISNSQLFKLIEIQQATIALQNRNIELAHARVSLLEAQIKEVKSKLEIFDLTEDSVMRRVEVLESKERKER